MMKHHKSLEYVWGHNHVLNIRHINILRINQYMDIEKKERFKTLAEGNKTEKINTVQ